MHSPVRMKTIFFYRQLYREGPPRCKWRKRGELAQGIGRSRGGRTSEIHAAVDESGRPHRLIITGGQIHDSKVMVDLLDGAGASTAEVGR